MIRTVGSSGQRLLIIIGGMLLLPAILLLSYAAVGATIYIFYGYKNSRLAKGLDVLDVGPDAQ